MAILSNDARLIKVGGIEYSAGSGISIDDYVISVSGEFGKTYSAGDNIGIYEQDNQLYISGKDWTDDINAASANAYAQATAMIPPEFDPSFISGAVDSISGELDDKLNSSSFNTWLDGQYTSDISHIEGEINYISGVTTAAQQNLDYLSGQIDNKLDTDTFTAWSAAQAENDYELSAGSGISLYNDDVNKLTRIDVTGTFGNPEVEEYVQTNSGTIDEVNSAVETYSASWNEVSAISGNYMATYGSTTLNQISNAINSGLDVYCRYNDGHGRILSAPLASNGYGAYTFTTTYNDNVYYFVIQPDGGDGAWSISSKSVLTAHIQSDWDVTATANPAYIQNKPDLSVYTTSAQVSAMIESACDTKFVAELYTTPYNEILSAYNEGKTILLSPVSGSLLSYDELNNQFTFTEEVYVIDDFEEGIGHTSFQYYFVDNNDDWTQNATISNVQADWNQTLSGEPDYIKNKPDLEDYAKVSSLNYYVPFSAEELPIGDSNTATNTGFAQGNSNSADNASLAQGYYNSASTYSLAQGGRNYAYQDSLAQGIDNSATQYSLAQGKSNSAYNYGVAIGSANSAFNYSQAFGRATVATASGMAIGTYNKTQDAAFVIGDGESEYLKSDSFIVYRDGSVSAKGKISAAGEELGGGGTSVDTIPVAVISPLVTGFSGESAYLGIESTALNLSSYVPVSSIGYNGTYISTISGKTISSYTGRYAMTANYANTADRAYKDRNSNEITSYYQPKLNIAGDAGTITAINGSAVGASIPEGWELVAGAGISIVDDAENNQTTISVTAAGGNPEVESYVQTNSGTIDDTVTSYQTNSGTFLTDVDLTPYYTTADANTLSSMLSGAIDYISGNAGTTYTGIAPIVVNGDTISADSFDITIGSGLAFENNTLYVSAQGGNPEVENYVQTNSGTIDETVTNVTTNSGTWGGSALPISAGPGVKVNLVDNTLVFSNDETILYNSETGTHNFTTTEPLTNFEEIKFVVNSWSNGPVVAETFVPMKGNNTTDLNIMYTDKYNGDFKMITFWQHYNNTNMTSFTADGGWWYGCNNDGNLTTGTWLDGTYIYKVVGINRKQ